MRLSIKHLSAGIIGTSLLAMCSLIPHFALTKSTNIHGLVHRTVIFSIVNMSDQPFCIQGQREQPVICVPAYQGQTDKRADPIKLTTGYFYTRSGLFHYWRGGDGAHKKMALIEKNSSHVYLRITPDGVIHHRNLNNKAKLDLKTYIKWHGLKGIL